ncbi:MAG TPA: hypothetical protein VFS31_13815 [Chitinophagaceae bacterium]|nr:hypothetical protein [Chitinophagaceae bacterium]
MKACISAMVLGTLLLTQSLSAGAQDNNQPDLQQMTELLWKKAQDFSQYFNSSDTGSMNRILDDHFMLQWMHENFLGRKGLLRAMTDTAVHASLMYSIEKNANTMLKLSDNGNAACLNASFHFLDSAMADSVAKNHGYGLCILYFIKQNDNWQLMAVHLDLHCSLCQF